MFEAALTVDKHFSGINEFWLLTGDRTNSGNSAGALHFAVSPEPRPEKHGFSVSLI
jgi:hypothetical protein